MREFLRQIGILKHHKQADIAVESARFRDDPAYQQYMDEARYNIVQQLWSLSIDDIDEFQKLKRFQMALDGFNDFIDEAILSDKLKQQRKVPTTQGR